MPTGYARAANAEQAKGLLDVMNVTKPSFWGLLGQNVQGMGKGLLDALMAPGNALAGQYDQYYDPSNGQTTYGRNGNPYAMMGDASNLAGMVTLGAGAVPGGAGELGMGLRVPPEFKHPISDTNLRKPLAEYSNTYAPGSPMVDRIAGNYEDLQGSYLFPIVSDRTAAGKVLTSIDGKPLENPVNLQGGVDFMRTHAPYGTAWANDAGVASKMAGIVRDVADTKGAKTNFVQVTMSNMASDSSRMMSDAIAEMAKTTKIPKTAAASFDAEIRKTIPGFVGIKSPELGAYLRTLPGGARDFIVKTMAKGAYQEAGLPDVVAARYAITEPSLLNQPTGTAGSAIATMDPTGRLVKSSPLPHDTYNTQIAGQYAGHFEPVPYSVMFPEWFNKRVSAEPNLSPGVRQNRDGRALMMAGQQMVQPANQQWLDGVMRYLEGRTQGGMQK